ncbi:hypothetical protein IMSAG013_00554 [Clostridiales bacterium]|nr:hypothetical protein IMSAG013_00554 [Clostridiales bacterium]
MALMCINAAGACSGCGMCADTWTCSICGGILLHCYYRTDFVRICRICASNEGSGRCVLCSQPTDMLVCASCQKKRCQQTGAIRS